MYKEVYQHKVNEAMIKYKSEYNDWFESLSQEEQKVSDWDLDRFRKSIFNEHTTERGLYAFGTCNVSLLYTTHYTLHNLWIVLPISYFYQVERERSATKASKKSAPHPMLIANGSPPPGLQSPPTPTQPQLPYPNMSVSHSNIQPSNMMVKMEVVTPPVQPVLPPEVPVAPVPLLIPPVPLVPPVPAIQPVLSPPVPVSAAAPVPPPVSPAASTRKERLEDMRVEILRREPVEPAR